MVLILVLESNDVRLDENLPHGDDELLVRHVGVHLQETNILLQEELDVHLVVVRLLRGLERLEAIDLVHHLLDVLVQPLNLLLRLESQLFLGAHRLLQGLSQLLLSLQLLDEVLALLALRLEIGKDVQTALTLRLQLLLQRRLLPSLRRELILQLFDVLLSLQVLLLRRLVRRALRV